MTYPYPRGSYEWDRRVMMSGKKQEARVLCGPLEGPFHNWTYTLCSATNLSRCTSPRGTLNKSRYCNCHELHGASVREHPLCFRKYLDYSQHWGIRVFAV